MLEKKSTKFLISCAMMALSHTTGAFADDCAPKPVCPPKPCCEPVVCPPMPEDCCERNICTPTGMITPRVDRIKGNAMDWMVSADYTYWTACEDNMEYALQSTAQGTGATEGANEGHVYRPGNKYASGFKVGLGSDFCHDGWDVFAQYTWFKSTNNNHTSGDSDDGVAGSLTDAYWFADSINNPIATTSYVSAASQWRVNMNVVDLALGRNFYVSPRLMLKPFYGLKGAWNKQHMNVDFVLPGQAGFSETFATTNHIKNWGIGIRGGMNTSWHFSRSFSIIGDMAFTALWEEFKVKRFDSRTNNVTGIVSGSNVDIKENQYGVKPVIEWMLGLKWETGLSCDAYHLAITAAWEEQVWFGQNKFLRLPGNAVGTGGDLSLQGLTIDVMFDF